MNREILFRGKRKDNGEWIEGFYAECKNMAFISSMPCVKTMRGSSCDGRGITDYYGLEFFYEVVPETVSRYTGLTDKNGRRIFEGDILKQGNHKYVVEWCDDCTMFVLPCITNEMLESDFTIHYGYEFEVCGNIQDNPELLGGEEK